MNNTMNEGSRKVQYAAAFCATIIMIYQGIIIGWTSPMIPKLLSGEAGVSITKDQCSWVASLVTFAAIPGSILSKYLVDKIGRKKSILFVAGPCITGSVIIIFASTPILIYIARVLSGIGSSMGIVVISMYLGEISDKEIRGFLGTLLTTMINLGSLFIFTIGPFMAYTPLNWICFSVPVIFLFSCIWIPESPYFYLKINDFDKAAEEMMKLKSIKNIKLIEKDLREIEKNVKRDMEKKTSVKELFVKKEYRKAVIILTGLKILQHMTGAFVIQSYLETILIEASMNISGSTGSVIYGIVQLLAGIVSAVLVDRMGRKPLLLISSLGTGISLTAVGTYFYIQTVLQGSAETMSNLSWLPMSGLVGFNILFAIGLANLPYVLQAEIFPTNVRSAASSVATIFGGTMSAVITKLYQGLVDSYGVHSVFWFFSAFSYLGVLFIYFVIPETKGNTLEEIQRKLNNISYIERAEEDSKEVERMRSNE